MNNAGIETLCYVNVSAPASLKLARGAITKFSAGSVRCTRSLAKQLHPHFAALVLFQLHQLLSERFEQPGICDE